MPSAVASCLQGTTTAFAPAGAFSQAPPTRQHSPAANPRQAGQGLSTGAAWPLGCDSTDNSERAPDAALWLPHTRKTFHHSGKLGSGRTVEGTVTSSAERREAKGNAKGL